jgi:hypothetical protein
MTALQCLRRCLLLSLMLQQHLLSQQTQPLELRLLIQLLLLFCAQPCGDQNHPGCHWLAAAHVISWQLLLLLLQQQQQQLRQLQLQQVLRDWGCTQGCLA